jgi:hypothetical protein
VRFRPDFPLPHWWRSESADGLRRDEVLDETGLDACEAKRSRLG